VLGIRRKALGVSQLLVFFLFSFSTFAFSPEVRLADEAQETRAMNLFLQVRCLVCGGQVIENSNTEFSFEMRKLIRQKISEGASNEKIKTDLVQKFGGDILTEPSAKNGGFLLWCLPIIFAIIVAVKIFYSLPPMRSSSSTGDTPRHSSSRIW
jgi:cytochrome c-type biogenesis protein CcmH